MKKAKYPNLSDYDISACSDSGYGGSRSIVNNMKNYESGSENEESAVIDGINVITERTKKLFTDNVRFRTAPSTNAETQIVDLYDISTGEITDVFI